ncbi:MAG: radical SAM protein, partial [Treponema sp.]|nr:radical SAM protein [Treponema sp.]
MVRYIDPLADIGEALLSVEKPARYSGGEYGRLAKKDAVLRMLVAFPDLYEIGMSNQAFRILYNRLNGIPGISCDRAFAPAADFEQLLREKGLPLYGLDTGISAGHTHVLMFTLGYELGITEVLAMLDVSSIPVHSEERKEEDPLVIMGGCCVSNPLPYAAFADAFWIGEAEAGFFELASELLELKKKEEGRGALLEKIACHPSVWVRGKKKAVRAVDAAFASRPPLPAIFPVAGMRVVQQHGAVEIMRGCPNGCRFCHAGFWYRPMRQKPLDVVIKEAEAFVEQGGYREISLYSLSSGDYRHIDALAASLDRRFSGRHISFQLPSLKISGFSLSLLEKISRVRKSGLAFAVETPSDEWQNSINKRVPLDDVSAILCEAKKNGWRGAKFYFMVGLPPAGDGEAPLIADFIAGIGRRTGTRCTVSLGIFVPKPHTPYQWADQLDPEEARRRCEYIRARLAPLGHKVNMPDPLTSVIEGIISRGDAGAGT